jgi:hypothetical protein
MWQLIVSKWFTFSISIKEMWQLIVSKWFNVGWMQMPPSEFQSSTSLSNR